MSRVVYTDNTGHRRSGIAPRRPPGAYRHRRGRGHRRQRPARRRLRFHLFARADNAPLFAVRRYRSYETHKLPSGEVFVIGYAQRRGRARSVDAAAGDRRCRFTRSRTTRLRTLVTIPYSRIRQHRQYAAPNQDGFTVTVAPRLVGRDDGLRPPGRSRRPLAPLFDPEAAAEGRSSAARGFRSAGSLRRRPLHAFHFQVPFRNSHALTNASVENATLTAMNTPVGPKPSGYASTQASGISHSHRQTD